ncbi:uncharacterized protein LOC117818037 [Xyrichtys novacula]|uniref:Uncharacterized protein LOC117818037 n=1 Tax=Xyrichtys novacula TaxID=13765 RepID=A0AAV1FDZ6_XYRNO|nr:uncharacterized protein LOC117818037 [Xyrichtys novacula]
MEILWLTLLLVQQGYAKPQVTTVQLGEAVTLTCVHPDIFSSRLFWYKQNAGETLALIVRLQTHIEPVYGAGFSPSRFVVNNNKTMGNLTILRTSQEDEGMYHCAVSEWINVVWSGVYLSLKGNTQRMSNLQVVQRPTVSDPIRPGDSLSLQCSVLSDSENQTCPGGHRVFWFKAGSDRSHPDLIYTDGDKQAECDQRSDPQKSCVYHFSKSVNSSDDGTYYCAVATCGRILFGDGARVDIEQTASTELISLIIALVCLGVSLVVNTVFICHQNPSAESEQLKAAVNLYLNSGVQIKQQINEDTQVYSAVVFSMGKADSGAVKSAKAERKRKIYDALKAFGLN